MSKDYDDTNRITLFATNARGLNAPTHQGKIVFTRDMIEKYDDVTYVVAITAWMQESGNMFGACSSYAEKMAEYREYQKSKEAKKEGKAGKAGKSGKAGKASKKTEDEDEDDDDIPF